MMGLALGGMIGSTVIVETLFSLPGMGTLIVRAAQQGDSPMLLGAVLTMFDPSKAGHRYSEYYGYQYYTYEQSERERD